MKIKNYLTNFMKPRDWFFTGIGSLIVIGSFFLADKKQNKNLEQKVLKDIEDIQKSKNREIVNMQGIPERYAILHNYGKELPLAYRVLLDKGIKKENIYSSENKKEFNEVFNKFKGVGPEDLIYLYVKDCSSLRFSGEFFQ